MRFYEVRWMPSILLTMVAQTGYIKHKCLKMSVNRIAISDHARMSKMLGIFEHTRKSLIYDESLISDRSFSFF